mgnify:FL=1
MADIKTRDTSKGTIKTINKAAVATERMKKKKLITPEGGKHQIVHLLVRLMTVQN